MEIKTLKIGDIHPYEKNPRKNDKSVAAVARSIEEFGWQQPIVVDVNHEIICGHTRYKAAKKLGMKEVPCVIAENLTEEQIKAYRLADNKVSESSEWDLPVLGEELAGIIDIDMSDFGFTLEVPEEIEPPDYKAETQSMKEDILNLGYAQFPGVGKYDIPEITPVYDLPEIEEWIGFNYVLSEKNPEGKGVHFFVDDYQFERVWNSPRVWTEKLSRFAAVMSPDFSPYGDMPLITQMYNHYRKHWCAAFWQSEGITVIPTIRSSTDTRSLEWYLDGEPRGGIVAYSSMWVRTDRKDIYQAAEAEYSGMMQTLKPSQVIVYGKKFDFMGDEVATIEKFTDKRWGN